MCHFDQLDPVPVRRIPSADPDADDKINAILCRSRSGSKTLPLAKSSADSCLGESTTFNKHSEEDAVILSLSSGRWQLTGSLFDLCVKADVLAG